MHTPDYAMQVRRNVTIRSEKRIGTDEHPHSEFHQQLHGMHCKCSAIRLHPQKPAQHTKGRQTVPHHSPWPLWTITISQIKKETRSSSSWWFHQTHPTVPDRIYQHPWSHRCATQILLILFRSETHRDRQRHLFHIERFPQFHAEA